LPADPASALSSGEQQQGARLRATAAGDAGVESFQPAFRNGLRSVQRTGEHVGDGAGGIGVATAIDDIDQLPELAPETKLKAHQEKVGLRCTDAVEPVESGLLEGARDFDRAAGVGLRQVVAVHDDDDDGAGDAGEVGSRCRMGRSCRSPPESQVSGKGSTSTLRRHCAHRPGPGARTRRFARGSPAEPVAACDVLSANRTFPGDSPVRDNPPTPRSLPRCRCWYYYLHGQRAPPSPKEEPP